MHCGTKMLYFEEHWAIDGSRTWKYSSSGKPTLRTELHKCVCDRVIIDLALVT